MDNTIVNMGDHFELIIHDGPREACFYFKTEEEAFQAQQAIEKGSLVHVEELEDGNS